MLRFLREIPRRFVKRTPCSVFAPRVSHFTHTPTKFAAMVHTIQGKEVGDIGFGLMGLTSPTKDLTDDEIIATLKAALEAGCNVWNGGYFYGTPERNSLTILKKYYEKYPEDVHKVLLNIKGCYNPAVLSTDMSPAGIQSSIQACLDQLGPIGRIDQFEPARKDPKVEIEVAMEAFKEQIKAGRIGGVALSEVSAKTIRRAAKVVKIAAVEIELSLWETQPLENGVLEACAELDIPVLAYSPLGRGLLTGQVRKYEDLHEHDWRRHVPRFHPDVFDTNLRLADAVEELARKKGCTPGQIAINWILAISRRPGMPRIIPIPGTTSAERIRENNVRVQLNDEDMAAIDKIMAQFPAVGDRYPKQGMDMLEG